MTLRTISRVGLVAKQRVDAAARVLIELAVASAALIAGVSGAWSP